MGELQLGTTPSRSFDVATKGYVDLPRVTSITSSATPTINTDNCNVVSITALATGVTSMSANLSGTPVDFQRLRFRIRDNGTSQSLVWGSSFANGPTSTPAGRALAVEFIYDSVVAKWECVGSTAWPAPQYVTAGGGFVPTTGSASFSYTHVVSVGDFIMIDVITDRTSMVQTITFDSSPVLLLGGVPWTTALGQFGFINRYGVWATANGTKTIAGSLNTGTLWAASQSVSYQNVSSVVSTQSYGSYNKTPPLLYAGCLPGQLVVASIAMQSVASGTLSGGTNRTSASNSNLSYEISDSPSPTNFSASTASAYWTGLATVLA